MASYLKGGRRFRRLRVYTFADSARTFHGEFDLNIRWAGRGCKKKAGGNTGEGKQAGCWRGLRREVQTKCRIKNSKAPTSWRAAWRTSRAAWEPSRRTSA